ncbi:MAG: hypothetical protein JW795_09665 [Chitinivibrionales bacterium]|nr:hypothetical protein [Chitinivibrionales bacterium]
MRNILLIKKRVHDYKMDVFEKWVNMAINLNKVIEVHESPTSNSLIVVFDNGKEVDIHDMTFEEFVEKWKEP